MGTETVPPPPTTPKPNRTFQPSADTAHVIKQTSQHCTVALGLPISRHAIANDLGQTVQQVELSYFYEHIFPLPPSGLDIAAVVNKLRGNGIVSGDRWLAFPQDPSKASGKEDEVFLPLASLIENVITAAAQDVQGLTQRFRYMSKPRNDVVTIYENKPSKPDGYFVPVGRDPSRVYWHEIGVSGAYTATYTMQVSTISDIPLSLQ